MSIKKCHNVLSDQIVSAQILTTKGGTGWVGFMDASTQPENIEIGQNLVGSNDRIIINTRTCMVGLK